MTWQTALQDPIFRRYAILILALLILSGGILALLTFAFHKNLSKVWTIWKSWLIMAPLGMLVVALGREAAILGGTLLALAAFKEYARATGLSLHRALAAIVYLAILAIGLAAFTGNFHLMLLLPVCTIALLFLVPIAQNQFKGQLQNISLALLGFLLIGWCFGHLLFLANSANPYGYLIFLVFAVEVSDIAAYISGKLFGRHPFRSNISPNKTWGGAIGALAVSLALPFLLSFSFPPNFTLLAKILTGLIVGIAGQLGDLSISLIKRDLAIKDMSAAIPGHGGILDRIDSLLFVAPIFVHLINPITPT